MIPKQHTPLDPLLGPTVALLVLTTPLNTQHTAQQRALPLVTSPLVEPLPARDARVAPVSCCTHNTLITLSQNTCTNEFIHTQV